MVFLNFNVKHKEKIPILNNFDESIVIEFCRISAESIQKEINSKTVTAAAQKLEMQAQDLRELIELLIWILVESSKMNLKEKEINESLELVGIKQELIKIINTSITDNQEQIKSYLRNLRMEVPSYSNLEWRVDIKLSTTTDRKIIEPEINFKLNLVKGDNKQEEAHILLTDVVNLVHLTNGLEEALNEIKTNYCRRVFRNIV